MANFFYFYIIFILFFYINSVICQTISARKKPGCALIANKIFCYGGYPLQGFSTLNIQHISLDLTQLHGITDLDDSKIQWNMLTDVINSTRATIKPRSYQGSAAVSYDNSYIMYGGIDTDSFLNYNPQTYTWRTLQVDPSINATNRNTIVNMGNDIFWFWGGENFPTVENYLPNIAHVYDYKAAKWIKHIAENNVPMRFENTATLSPNGGIYVLGGATRYPDGNFNYSNFNEVRKFDTKSSQWSYFTATGHSASIRVSHTATQLPNKNQLFIYGGVNSDPAFLKVNGGEAAASLDYCIVFDYDSNTFQNIDFPTLPGSVNIRYGHFAEIYNETYLVMAFGFINERTAATSLSVLNITDPLSPQWVRSFPGFSNNTNTSKDNDNDKDDKDKDDHLSGGIIAAIVVPVVVVVLIAIVISIYFYKKREKKYKFPKIHFTKSSETVIAAHIKPAIEDVKRIKPSTSNNDYVNTSSTNLPGNSIKPSEYIEKPFGNET
ncbi:unnamed protein product [Cunninghamella echinulata]